MTRLSTALIILSFGAGATDAFAFLMLGGIFTANMTGNLVLIALLQRPTYLVTLLGAGVAIAVFVAALLAGFRLTATRSGTVHPRARQVLVAGAVAQTAVLVWWVAIGGSADLPVQVGLVGLSAVAMAAQTVVSKRVSSLSGVTTTYVTGTLTSVMEDIADGKPGERAIRVVSVISVATGALAGSLSMTASPVLGAVLPCAAVWAALLFLATARRPNRVKRLVPDEGAG